MPALPPLYQLASSPNGAWRARVFNLPPHREGQPPTLPFLLALAARPVGQARDWQPDPEAKLTVLRLGGTDRMGQERLLRLLSAHGIARVLTLAGPVRKPGPAAVPG